MQLAEQRPWLDYYGPVPATLDYPPVRLDEALSDTADRQPDHPAYTFLGQSATYAQLQHAVERCAAGLVAHGVVPGDRITISMPTSPHGLIVFYAASMIGAVSSLIHPLSSPDEIEQYLRLSRSRFAITLDVFYERFAQVRERTGLDTLVLVSLADDMPLVRRIVYQATIARKTPRVPPDAEITWWRQLVETDGEAAAVPADPDDLATILYSGGTTGTPKGIMLSHRNVTSEALEVATWVGLSERDVVLAVLPIFHGFGLGAQVHAAVMVGAKLVMAPRFSPPAVAGLLRHECPTVMAGVPTLYESLARHRALQHADLSSLRAAFSGADILQPVVRESFERLVAARGGHVRILEGYGLTEAVTAVMCNPLHAPRNGTVGVPFPDVVASIFDPGTDRELASGEEGEICISGPPVMLGYLDNPEATAEALRRHGDGRTWLHTGDLGRVDDDGYFTFSCRLKRMIKSSGFNVYPTQVEAILGEHPAVRSCCVIGVPDTAQGERVKALVVPRDPSTADSQLTDELIEHCQARLIKWSCPREIELRRSLPVTRFGKIDYRALTDEAKRGVVTSDRRRRAS